MKVVVDTNIAFSAILNTNSKIGEVIIKSGNLFSFYSSLQLKSEIYEYKDKILQISTYSEAEFNEISNIIFRKITFISDLLIPEFELLKAEELTKDVDIDDTVFVALSNHLNAKLWSGDKSLKRGLESKNWHKFITLEELYNKMYFKK